LRRRFFMAVGRAAGTELSSTNRQEADLRARSAPAGIGAGCAE